MDLKQLRKDLKMRPRLISIAGSEQVFIKQACAAIISEYCAKDNIDFNVNFTDTDTTSKEVITLLQEMPFGDDTEKKVVFAYNCSSYQSKTPSTAVLVSLDNSIKNPQLTVDCKKLFGRHLVSYITSEAKKLDLNMDKADVHLFIENNGNDIQTLNNELLKLSLLGDKSSKTIRLLSSANLTSKLDDFAKSFSTKNTYLALKTYEDLVDLGSSPSSIFGYIVYIFKNLLNVLFLESVEKEESYDTRKFFRIKDTFDIKFITDAILHLSTIDFDVRNGSFPMAILLISLTKRDFSVLDSYIERSAYS